MLGFYKKFHLKIKYTWLEKVITWLEKLLFIKVNLLQK